MLKLMLITNCVPIAVEAHRAGVDRIFIDLERLGKHERQGHLDTHIASHTIDDAHRIRDALPDTELLVRTNPLHDNSREEVDAIISAGTDVVMLPMFTTVGEVAQFAELVAGRADISLLVETPQALVRINEILDCSPDIREVHLGLNDLHIAMGLDFMFELLSGGIVDHAANAVTSRGLVFGFGGIARLGNGDLPAEFVIGEHVRLGSSVVILSRAFHQNARTVEELRQRLDLASEVVQIRECEAKFRTLPHSQLAANAHSIRRQVAQLVPTQHPTWPPMQEVRQPAVERRPSA